MHTRTIAKIVGLAAIFGFFVAFLGDSNVAYAQSQLQSSVNFGDVEVEMYTTGPIGENEPMEAYPVIANGTDYTFNIFFRHPNSNRTLESVDYNVMIFLNEKEVYDLAKQSQSGPALHTATGNATVTYKFESSGAGTVRVSVLGINDKPIDPPHIAYFGFFIDSKRIPEFLIGGMVMIAIAVTTFAIIITNRKHLYRR